MEGSVRKQGNQVRITAQLIKADDGYHLWSESYDGSLDNIFELQDQISRAVATELKGVLGVEDATPLVAKLTENKEAYDLYLQGRDLMFRTWGLDTLPNAVRLLKRAVALDPEFAEAWGVLGRATHLLPQYVPVADEQPYREAARQAAETSISLDPSLPYGYSVLASLAVVEHDHVEAYELWKKAFTLDGSSVTQAFSMGYGLSVLGRSREALLYLEKAVETDPMQGILMLNLGIAKLNNGDAEEAERHARRSVELGFIGAAFTVAELLAERGEYEKAVAYINEQRQSLNAYAPMYRSDEQWQLAITAGYTDNEEAKQIAVEGIEGYLQTPDAVVNTSIVEALRSFHAPELFMETLENNRFSNSSYVLTRLWSGTEASNLIRRHPGFPGFAERIGLLAAWQEFGWPDKCRPNEGTDGSNGRFTCD